MNYVPLHVYDGYSFLKSGMTTANYVSYCKKQGFNELGIANLGVCHSFPSFERFCLDNSIHPVFGLDVYIEGNLLTLFIKNEEGYKNICFLSSKLKDNSLEYDDLLDNGDGLIGVFPTSNPKLYDYFLHNQKELPKFLVKFSKLVDDFYLGLEFYDDIQKGYIDFIRSFAFDFSYEIVMFPHIKYIKKEDEITLQIVNAIKNSSQLVAQEATGPNYILNDEEVNLRYSDKERENTYNISHKCLVKIDEKRGKILRYNALDEDECYELLKEKSFSGLKEKIPNYTSIYEERLN